MTHSVTFCRSSRGGLSHSHLQQRQDGGEPLCSGSGFFLMNVSNFGDYFRRIGMRPPDRRTDIPPLSCCWADNSHLCQLRSIYFILCGMRLSFNNSAYLMFSESLCFIKNKFSCFMCFWRLFYVFIAGISQADGTSWSACCDNDCAVRDSFMDSN